jgi:hypothetical protein
MRLRTTAERWTFALILLGLALRGWHYFRCPSVWHDEAALIINVLRLDFAQLLGPLTHHEAAPPLFLWVERAAVLAFGDGVYSLRLIPFLAACGSLLLFAAACRRVLSPAAAAWAVGFFAVSDRLLWHACEAKPYAIDTFLGAAVLYGFVRTQHWPVTRQCLLWLPLAPLTIWLSYPACFLCGGLLVALFPSMWKARAWRDWLSYAVLASAIGLAFLLLYIGPAKAQRDGAMEGCWLGHFPNWSRPWGVPVWSFFATSEVFRYDLLPLGQFLSGFAIVGAALLWRANRALVLLLLAPLGLGFFAACMHAYPYGGARVIVFTAPAMLLLIGAGVPPAWEWLQRRWRFALVPLTALLLTPFEQTAYRLLDPWPRADSAAAAAFVREHRRPDDAVACNHWEHEYYLRDVPRVLHDQSIPSPEAGARAWVVVTGATAEERNSLLNDLSPLWDPLMEQPFPGTIVLLLERRPEALERWKALQSLDKASAPTTLTASETEASEP